MINTKIPHETPPAYAAKRKLPGKAEIMRKVSRIDRRAFVFVVECIFPICVESRPTAVIGVGPQKPAKLNLDADKMSTFLARIEV